VFQAGCHLLRSLESLKLLQLVGNILEYDVFQNLLGAIQFFEPSWFKSFGELSKL
jgi:hypothetical protein